MSAESTVANMIPLFEKLSAEAKEEAKNQLDQAVEELGVPKEKLQRYFEKVLKLGAQLEAFENQLHACNGAT